MALERSIEKSRLLLSFHTGKSILDRTNKTNIGDLMLKYGGGGHAAAGTCQVDNTQPERVVSGSRT